MGDSFALRIRSPDSPFAFPFDEEVACMRVFTLIDNLKGERSVLYFKHTYQEDIQH